MNKTIAKNNRSKKKQLGQFMTPDKLSYNIVSQYKFNKNDRVLEPSFGEGSFLIPIINKFIGFYHNYECPVLEVLNNNVFGVEYDIEKFNIAIENIERYFSVSLKDKSINLVNDDYFKFSFNIDFDYVIGNPPFGGTFDSKIEDDLDKKYGRRLGEKIKKETYSFFIVKSMEELKPNGSLDFICSDTFLTINTMFGLRNYLMTGNAINIKDINYFSDETDYGMVNIKVIKNTKKEYISINENEVSYDDIKKTKNYSWKVNSNLIKYFTGKVLSDFLICSSGMTIGNNELFVRKINSDNTIYEPYKFSFYQKKIKLEDEISRARLNKLSDSKKLQIKKKEENGETKEDLSVVKLTSPNKIQLPNKNYLFYNKAENDVVYTDPKWVIYWGESDGKEVYTFKKNGNWYLHGVGGKKFFKKEGLTWSLISDSIKIRYLPEGYILDSGSPVAVLKPNINKEKLYFIMGWLLTNLCNRILKEVINHTKNIQGKDIERLPYPSWAENNMEYIVKLVKLLIEEKKKGSLNQKHIQKLNELFEEKNETL